MSGCRERGRDDAHRTAVLPQQAALRWPGHLRAPPEPRAGPPRAPGRGVLRPAVSRAGSRRAADEGAQPRPLPRARPVPGARAAGVPRPRGRRGVPDHVHGRVPRAEDVQHPGRPAAARAGGRLRRGARQPGARPRDARHRADGAAAGDHRAPPDHLRPADRPGQRHQLAQAALAASLVRLPADAAEGRAPGPQDPDPVGVVGAGHRPGLRRRPRPDAGDPARRGRRLRAADRTPGAGPDHRDGQCRCPDEGDRDPARGVRQAAYRAASWSCCWSPGRSPVAGPSS